MAHTNAVQIFLDAFTQLPDQATAVRVFSDALAPHHARIAATDLCRTILENNGFQVEATFVAPHASENTR